MFDLVSYITEFSDESPSVANPVGVVGSIVILGPIVVSAHSTLFNVKSY